MVTLSILISATDETGLEATLLSVLENRPEHCEIVVVHDEGYSDPYQLAGEISFVFVAPASNELTRLRVGLESCQAPLVHILRCGAAATPRWTEASLAHFADPRVAAVSPLVVDEQGARVESAGVDYSQGGKRIVRARHVAVSTVGGGASAILGPTLDAAFYRRSALEQLRQVFDPAIGASLADVDFGAALARNGYRAVLEPQSRVIAAPRAWQTRPLSDAWLAERLFWRHARHFGRWHSLASHVAVIAADAASCLFHPLRAGCLLGRLAGLLEQLRFASQDADSADQTTSIAGGPDSRQIRVDGPSRLHSAGAENSASDRQWRRAGSNRQPPACKRASDLTLFESIAD